MSQQDWTPPELHPVLACVRSVEMALKDVADVDPGFMSTPAKRAALMGLASVEAQLAELKLRVLAVADDVVTGDGSRDAAAWVDHHQRVDRSVARTEQQVAEAIRQRWGLVREGMAQGSVSLAQAAVITRALEAMPEHLEREVKARAEERLVAEAASFGPKELRIMGRRILDVVAPELGEEQERKSLEAEEQSAAQRTWLTGRRLGDGRTKITGEVPDATWDRLETYLEGYLSPRQQGRVEANPDDRRPYEMRLGSAFAAFLEHLDPQRLPIHGGDATTVMVTIELDSLSGQVDASGVAHLGDEPISAAAVRRLACTAHIIPAVLGGDGQVLDLGRSRRLFSRAQRKALRLRHRRCRARGCRVKATWCEAHHLRRPWAQGGSTDLADGTLLCSWHHHRAHDPRYETEVHPDGDITFHRRT